MSEQHFTCPFCEREICGFNFCPYCHEEFLHRNQPAVVRGDDIARRCSYDGWIARATKLAAEIIKAAL